MVLIGPAKRRMPLAGVRCDDSRSVKSRAKCKEREIRE